MIAQNQKTFQKKNARFNFHEEKSSIRESVLNVSNNYNFLNTNCGPVIATMLLHMTESNNLKY